MQIISRLNIFIVLRCISFYLRVRQSQRHRCIHYCKKLWMLIWLADIQGNLVTMCVELYHAQGVSISRSFKFNRISNENNTTTINHIREIIRPYYWLVNVIWKRPTGFTPSPPCCVGSKLFCVVYFVVFVPLLCYVSNIACFSELSIFDGSFDLF